MGFPPSRILPLSTQNLSVATISPRLDQEAECPAGDSDDGDDGDDDGDGDVDSGIHGEDCWSLGAGRDRS